MRLLKPLLIGCLFLAATGASATETLFGPHGLKATCGTEADMRAALTEQLTGDPATREADRVAGEKAYRAVQALHAQILGGGPAPAAYARAGHLAALAAAAKSDRTRTLFQRAIRGRLLEPTYQAALSHTAWAAGLSDHAIDYAFVMAGRDTCGMTAGDTAWLKAEIRKGGWFPISRDGREADAAAWLMAHHSDQDVAFQKEVLAMLEPLLARHETSASNFAYLYDHVAVAELRPQRFGTQGMCADDGHWRAQPTEDSAKLDARRAAAGLPPEATYIAMFQCRVRTLQ